MAIVSCHSNKSSYSIEKNTHTHTQKKKTTTTKNKTKKQQQKKQKKTTTTKKKRKKKKQQQKTKKKQKKKTKTKTNRTTTKKNKLTYLFVPPAYRCYMWNMVRMGFMASKEMSFENVERQTTDGRHMPTYTISSPLSHQLRWAKN